MTAQLDALNTLGVPSQARTLHRIEHAEQLRQLIRQTPAGTLVILGGGSNVVLGERIDRPVCLMRNRGIRVHERADTVEVSVQAGENWHDLVRWSLGQGYQGLENLALIPGSVGAAPVQNIGAYGVELASRLLRVEVMELNSAERLSLPAADCEFSYRSSLFKNQPGRYVILELTLSLSRRPAAVESGYADVGLELARMGCARPTAVQLAEAVIRIRRRKLPDPRFVPNAGSFFKNPVVDQRTYSHLQSQHGDLKSYPDAAGVKLAAAQLIERCLTETGAAAWTGDQAPVRIWHRQPLVLTNPGRRPASEVLSTAGLIRDAVEARFGIRLELEPDTIDC